MADVFMSYKSEDRRRVARLVEALERRGIAVWWDLRIEGGADWRHRLQSELDAARVVLVVWSRHSVGPDGAFVQDEASQALHAGKYLPVCIDAVTPPLGFGGFQSIDLAGWRGSPNDRRLAEVVRAVRAQLAGELLPVMKAGEAGQDRRRFLLWGAAGAVMAGAGATFWLHRGAMPEMAGQSIVVLPFADMSASRDNGWLADGLAEELRMSLGRIPGLRVISRVSSETFREPVDLPALVRALGVTHLLSGSVRSGEGRFRIAAQLSAAADGRQLWAQSFDEARTDSLEVQRRVAAAVLQALNISLGPAARALMERGGTRVAGAQDLYLQALAMRGTDRSAHEQRLQLLDAAVAQDPSFALAHASRGTTLFGLSQLVPVDEVPRLRAAAREAYARAGTIEPGLALIRQGHANMLEFELKPRPALEAHRKSMQLPGSEDSRIPGNFSRFLWILAHYVEAERVADAAIAVDPVNPRAFLRKAMAVAGQKRPEAALQLLDEADQLAPPLDESIRTRARIAFAAGQGEEAIGMLDGMRDAIGRLYEQERMWALLGDEVRADAAARAGGEAGAPRVWFARAWRAAVSGRSEAALGLLEESLAKSENYLLMLPQFPEFADLWRHPRMVALVRRIDFPMPVDSPRDGFYGPKGPLG
jgi:serine/threonine-protein kinase